MKGWKGIAGLLLGALLWAGCRKSDPPPVPDIPTWMWEMYANGEISRCTYQGKVVYVGALNAYDAGFQVYDAYGRPIGSCNFAWGSWDSVCGRVENCCVLYRVPDNMWGLPAVP